MLFDALDGARLVLVDRKRQYFLVWHGGHTINVYDTTGQNVSVWTTGDPSLESIPPSEAENSMLNHIAEGCYP
jgi:hypothetical protein